MVRYIQLCDIKQTKAANCHLLEAEPGKYFSFCFVIYHFCTKINGFSANYIIIQLVY